VPPDRPPLRVGVACDSLTLPSWQAGALDGIVASGDGGLALRIVRPGTAPAPEGRTSSARPAWAAYRRWWVATRSEAARPVDASDRFAGVPRAREADVDRVRAEGLDVILDLTSGPPPLGLVEAARLGVWRFRFGEPEEEGREPGCFWEVDRGEPVTSVALLRMTGLYQGVVLYRGVFRTHRWSFVRNLDAVCPAMAEWPARLLTRLGHGDRRLPDDAIRVPPTRPRYPGILRLVRLAATATGRLVLMQLRSLFLVEQWNVGVVDTPIHRFLDGRGPARVRWLPQPGRDQFLADPFGVRREGRLSVVMEEWDHRRRTARIVAVEMDEHAGFSEPTIAMEPPFHVSYPYLVEWDGDLYCIPETGRLGRVDVYRCTDFPRRWVRVGSLIEGFPARDPTVFRHEGRWWLLCGAPRLASAELHAWYADDLQGPWHPHHGNPLKTDIRSARPAGTPFTLEGRLYRPAQDGSRTYGGGVSINRIVRLTPDEFAEEPVATVRPPEDGPYRSGIHTLSAVGDVTLIDAKRVVFVWAAFRRRLAARLGGLGGAGFARRSAPGPGGPPGNEDVGIAP